MGWHLDEMLLSPPATDGLGPAVDFDDDHGVAGNAHLFLLYN